MCSGSAPAALLGARARERYACHTRTGYAVLGGMKLFLLGATGRTGTELVDLALARGHEVTAFVRSPGKLDPARPLRVVRGDPRDREALAAALPGHDAVLSAIGPAPRDALRPSTLLADCAVATVAAMTTAGVERIAVVSAALLFPLQGLRFAFFRWMLQHHLRDLRAMEDAVQASRLAWTIARPPQLTRSPDASFRALRDALPPGSYVTSFRSVAAFMIEAVEQRTHLHEIVGITR
jgi:putative NADH-flavin reductase